MSDGLIAAQIAYADVETAGALQSLVDRAGLKAEIDVRCVPGLCPGVIMTAGGEAFSFELVRCSYTGPRVLLADGLTPGGASPG